ncbi:hypothetical protein JVU11DRAFT_3644 [Chiua virens]|nr:hypothetical protein JVU11DRAFT_3644 [Chiua virens]
MTAVMLVLWGSAFFMDIIGVNAIFGVFGPTTLNLSCVYSRWFRSAGAFVVGMIIPREGGVSIAFAERLEDIVQTLFLPLYFTTSGLNTNLGLLNTGKAWGFLFAISALDFTATAVGSLMSCKGLVGLIVLNVGLSADILTPQHRTFTSATRVVNTSFTDDIEKAHSVGEVAVIAEEWRSRFTVVLDEFDHMSGIMALTKLVLSPTSDDLALSNTKMTQSVNALRLIELSERTSTIMKSAMTEMLINTDLLLGVFEMFGEQNDIPVSASLSVVPREEWANTVTEHAQRHGSQFVLIPWISPTSGSPADPPEAGMSHPHCVPRSETCPLDTFFGLSTKVASESASTLHSQFVRGVFQHSKTDVALFVDFGNNTGTNGRQHILLPFFGGPDDRLALEFVVQLCANPRVRATVVRVGRGSVQGLFAGSESAVVEVKPELETGTSITLVRT